MSQKIKHRISMDANGARPKTKYYTHHSLTWTTGSMERPGVAQNIRIYFKPKYLSTI